MRFQIVHLGQIDYFRKKEIKKIAAHNNGYNGNSSYASLLRVAGDVSGKQRKKMKRLLSILILILWQTSGFSQENTIWVDSILTQIVLNKIEIYDTNFKVINNIDIELIPKDTVVNCLWTRPRYIDNILQSSCDGIVIDNPIIFDTLENQKNNEYIDFKYPKYDGYGNYLNDTIVFIIKRKPQSQSLQLDKSPLIKKLINTEWKIDKIFDKEIEIELDSCHKVFNLKINEDFTFTQRFGDNDDCSTLSMKENKEVGVEGDYDEFMKYHNKIQGHYLSVKKGIWKIEENNFLLIDLDEKRTLSFKIEKLNKKKLHLKFKKSDYTIKMKKASR